VVLSELKAFKQDLSGDALERGLKGRLAGPKAEKKIGDIQLLNLLVHHPKAVTGLINSDCSTLLSDETASRIVEVIFDKYRKEGQFSPENIEETSIMTMFVYDLER